MPAGTGSQFKTVADAVKVAFDAEFAVEGFVMTKDNIHQATGQKGVRVGIAPVEDSAMGSNKAAMEVLVEVRFHDQYRDERNPNTVVNPERITEFAERFRRCLVSHGVVDPGTNQVWFFDVLRVRYPNDPTGNKTRFWATIRAFGDNTGLYETRG